MSAQAPDPVIRPPGPAICARAVAGALPRETVIVVADGDCAVVSLPSGRDHVLAAGRHPVASLEGAPPAGEVTCAVFFVRRRIEALPVQAPIGGVEDPRLGLAVQAGIELAIDVEIVEPIALLAGWGASGPGTPEALASWIGPGIAAALGEELRAHVRSAGADRALDEPVPAARVEACLAPKAADLAKAGLRIARAQAKLLLAPADRDAIRKAAGAGRTQSAGGFWDTPAPAAAAAAPASTAPAAGGGFWDAGPAAATAAPAAVPAASGGGFWDSSPTPAAPVAAPAASAAPASAPAASSPAAPEAEGSGLLGKAAAVLGGAAGLAAIGLAAKKIFGSSGEATATPTPTPTPPSTPPAGEPQAARYPTPTPTPTPTATPTAAPVPTGVPAPPATWMPPSAPVPTGTAPAPGGDLASKLASLGFGGPGPAPAAAPFGAPVPGAPVPGASVPGAAVPGWPVPSAAMPVAGVPTAPVPTSAMPGFHVPPLSVPPLGVPAVGVPQFAMPGVAGAMPPVAAPPLPGQPYDPAIFGQPPAAQPVQPPPPGAGVHPAQSASMRCVKCGQVVPAGKFCLGCGAPL